MVVEHLWFGNMILLMAVSVTPKSLASSKDNQMMKSVDLQENDINSTLNFYRNMIGIRKSNLALSKGKMIFIHDANNVLIYRRNFQGEEVIIVPFNFNKKAVSFLNIEVVK